MSMSNPFALLGRSLPLVYKILSKSRHCKLMSHNHANLSDLGPTL